MMTVCVKDAPTRTLQAAEAMAAARKERHQLATSLPTTEGTEWPEAAPHRAAVRMQSLRPPAARAGARKRDQRAVSERRSHFFLQKAYHVGTEGATGAGLHMNMGLHVKFVIGNTFVIRPAAFPNLAARLLALLDARRDLVAYRWKVLPPEELAARGIKAATRNESTASPREHAPAA